MATNNTRNLRPRRGTPASVPPTSSAAVENNDHTQLPVNTAAPLAQNDTEVPYKRDTGLATDEGPSSLLDLVRSPLSDPPAFFKSNASFLCSTKQMTQGELNLVETERLKHISFCPNMFDSLLAQARRDLKQFTLDPNNAVHRQFVEAVSPYCAPRRLPPTVQSEKDIESWVRQGILQPALEFAHVLLESKIPEGPATAADSAKKPYISSSTAGAITKSVPDLVVMCPGKDNEYRATCEVKTDKVIVRNQAQDDVDVGR